MFKQRIQIIIVCFVSFIPCPLYFGLYELNVYIYNMETLNVFLYIVASSLTTLALIILQCIEEICLFVISKDFRNLIKNQFVKKAQNNIVVPRAICVSQSSQLFQIRQPNVQQKY